MECEDNEIRAERALSTTLRGLPMHEDMYEQPQPYSVSTLFVNFLARAENLIPSICGRGQHMKKDPAKTISRA